MNNPLNAHTFFFTYKAECGFLVGIHNYFLYFLQNILDADDVLF